MSCLLICIRKVLLLFALDPSFAFDKINNRWEVSGLHDLREIARISIHTLIPYKENEFY